MENKDKNEEMTYKKKLRIELIIHSIILIILLIICGWDRKVNIPKFPKNFLFLTQICLYTNIVYYSIGSYNNIKQQMTVNKNTKLLLLFNFNFCVSFVVFIMYWSLLFIDKSNLYRKDSKIQVPTLLNMLLHGGVFTSNLVEIFFVNKRSKKPYINIIFYFFFTFIYLSLLYILKIFFDIKVYPFIYGNFLKFLLIALVSVIICLIGHYVYIFITKQKDEKNDKNNYEEFELTKTI